jgi:hypothetical protein
VHGQIERRRLEIQQIVFAGQRLDRRDFRGADLAASRGFELRHVFFDVAAQRPGVLITELGFEGEAVRLDADRMCRPHVEPQAAERREIARTQHSIEPATFGSVRPGSQQRQRPGDQGQKADSTCTIALHHGIPKVVRKTEREDNSTAAAAAGAPRATRATDYISAYLGRPRQWNRYLCTNVVHAAVPCAPMLPSPKRRVLLRAEPHQQRGTAF